MKNIIQESTIDLRTDLVLAYRKEQIDREQIAQYASTQNIDFEGDLGEFLLLQGTNGQRIYLLGLGLVKDRSRIFEAFRKLAFKTQKFWKNIQCDLTGFDPEDVQQAALGLTLADYQIGVFKTESKTEEEQTVALITENADAISEGVHAGTTINRIKALVDAPANVKTPAFLANWAQESGKAHGYEVEVFEEKRLIDEGFGAIMAVGKGSQYPPAMIVMKHLPKPGAVDIALVGKGITFDTGGLSIKPSSNLHYMKSDMGGAAAVLGTMELAARLNLNVNVIGVVAAAENAVDAKSFLPGDVIKSYSGKTIEIIDTDAEGRLVLADALNYVIKNHKPHQVIDLATLTGSVVRTLGYSAAGLFTHNETMRDQLIQSGESIHEKLWHLPMFDDLDDDLHSDIADLRNFSNRPVAGASSAAKFLEAFTEDHKSWAHLDIAGMAFGSSEYAKMKCASGYGVRLMTEYLKQL